MDRLLSPLALALLVNGIANAAEPVTAPPAGRSDNPDYPRVNLAAYYEADPSWPERPPNLPWGDVPGIAVDKEDNVWVFTRTNPPVQVFRADGKFVRAWGEGVVSRPHHLRIDREGNVWLADIGWHIVRKCTPEGKVLLTLGTPGQKGLGPNLFYKPTDIAIAPNGDVFISDGYGNSRVSHFDRNGKFIKDWGAMGNGPRDFSIPHAIVLDSRGRLYVADRNNVRVQVYSQAGRLLDSWANLIVPWGLWMTAKEELWVCGSSPMSWQVDPKYPAMPLGCPPKDQLFMKFNTSGKLLQLWSVPKAEDGKERAGECTWVHCLALDSKGNIYAGDIVGKRAQKFVRKN